MCTYIPYMHIHSIHVIAPDVYCALALQAVLFDVGNDHKKALRKQQNFMAAMRYMKLFPTVNELSSTV